MGEPAPRTWKIGELARATGLTVRTLHHYDRVGLLTPSARTASGHRIYTEPDVDRLYRVLALRELGLPLNTIGGVLDGGRGLPGLLTEHLTHVEARLRALRIIRTRLTSLLAAAERSEHPGSGELLELIEEMTSMDELINKYYTEEQLAQLAQRREQVGEQAIADVAAEWPELIAAVQAELDAGTDPAEPTVRTLARRWMELLESFHGGDPGLRDSLYTMYAENSEQIRQQGGPSAELIEYVGRANAAGGC